MVYLQMNRIIKNIDKLNYTICMYAFVCVCMCV